MGCPFRCAYCFLQIVPYFRFNKKYLMGLVYRNWDQMLAELDEWLSATTARMLLVGELQDGLVFDNAYKAITGKALTHHLIPRFAAQRRHRLIFLTKSTLIKHARHLQPTPQVVFSWSVNVEYAARRWEIGPPLPSRRLRAAMEMKKRGWTVRIRLDPIIPYDENGEHWRDGYAQIIDQINELGPEMVTIGALRATSTALGTVAAKNGRAADIFRYLTAEKDPSGFKYRIPFDKQVEMYRFVVERLDRRRTVPALCKEDVSVWKAAGLRFNGCHCLLEGTQVPRELMSAGSFKAVIEKDPRDGISSETR